MLSKADNEFLTASGKGTPMGDLLRRFWMPALLSAELPERDGPPKKIKILGEDLLAFRDGGSLGGSVVDLFHSTGSSFALSRWRTLPEAWSQLAPV